MATMTQSRARKGGQTGMNGLHYPAGTFLPTTTLDKLPKRNPGTGVRKVQVEPYVWVVDSRRPIFSLAGAGAIYSHATKRMALYPDCFYGDGSPRPGVGSYTADQVRAFCDRFNAGERWM